MMQGESQAQAPMTPEQMRAKETDAARLVDVWVSAFKRFPNDQNFEGVMDQLKEYATAWMHTRSTFYGTSQQLITEVLDYTQTPDNMDRVDGLGSWMATTGWFKRAKRLLGYEDEPE